ncbi:hypothetical protein H9638_13190 [Arthrobacter sp. Sa2BUA2]|uniref:Uncharacterized protein n=1 Tax=Arthrobacter pullicola TaxID=2762224 RepID=A0ABR8YKI3_9MICC|nr:hypothetical protein [Arthrobacter pullicola]MBD8044762.1 hypothetical protein [Arthrobacter pullicola]
MPIFTTVLLFAGIIAAVILIVLIFRGSRVPEADIEGRKRVNRWFWILGVFVAAAFIFVSFT